MCIALKCLGPYPSVSSLNVSIPGQYGETEEENEEFREQQKDQLVSSSYGLFSWLSSHVEALPMIDNNFALCGFSSVYTRLELLNILVTPICLYGMLYFWNLQVSDNFGSIPLCPTSPQLQRKVRPCLFSSSDHDRRLPDSPQKCGILSRRQSPIAWRWPSPWHATQWNKPHFLRKLASRKKKKKSTFFLSFLDNNNKKNQRIFFLWSQIWAEPLDPSPPKWKIIMNIKTALLFGLNHCKDDVSLSRKCSVKAKSLQRAGLGWSCGSPVRVAAGGAHRASTSPSFLCCDGFSPPHYRSKQQ